MDYMTKHGASLYEQGIKALRTPFSIKAAHVEFFEKELQDRVSMTGLDKGTHIILRFTNRYGKQISLIAKYGHIIAGTYKTACEPYILKTGINSDK